MCRRAAYFHTKKKVDVCYKQPLCYLEITKRSQKGRVAVKLIVVRVQKISVMFSNSYCNNTALQEIRM